MGSYWQGRSLVGAGLSLVLMAATQAGCKKESAPPAQQQAAGESPTGTPAEGKTSSGWAPMRSPGGGDPHAGMNMGGGDPHAGMNMGGGKTLEKTADGRVVIGSVTYAMPKAWQERPTSSQMRAAEIVVPGAAEGQEAELIVYYFGEGGAGSAEDNLKRWFGQFQAEGGGEVATKSDKAEVSGMAVTFAEAEGRYVAAMMPGQPGTHDKPNSMLLGAIVETPSGPYYFKLVGPKATATTARGDFRGFIESAKPR